MNTACYVKVELPLPVCQWLELKLHNEPPPHYAPVSFRLSATDYETFSLKEAQLQSGSGRGRLALATGFDTVYVFWHRVGHLPEDRSGTRCMAAGSPYWELVSKLRTEEVWVPDDPLNAMEVLARAASDEPTFAIMTQCSHSLSRHAPATGFLVSAFRTQTSCGSSVESLFSSILDLVVLACGSRSRTVLERSFSRETPTFSSWLETRPKTLVSCFRSTCPP